ncbi:MAG: IclR family transcriptional regulator [Clostridia bacterium]
MEPKSTKLNQSVEKTIRIIETLANAMEPLRLSQIAISVDMPPSTVLRMLATLVECGYAYQEDSDMKRYGLTMRFTQIGQKIADHFSIREVAHPYLLRLVRGTGESGCLAIEDRGQVRYLDVVEATQSLITIRQRVGGSAPMHATGSGKLFLAQYSEERLEAFVEQYALKALTPHTIGTLEELRYELACVRKNGYAVDDEECEIGMRCLAAPIYDVKKQLIGTISLSGPISRMIKLRNERDLIPALCDSCRQITAKISGTVTEAQQTERGAEER